MSNHKRTNNYKRVNTNTQKMSDVSQILVVSDLHLSEGLCKDGIHWHRRENFPFDEAFGEFLEVKRKEARQQGSQFWLIINGDFIDFLRITDVPKSEEDLHAWEQQLDTITDTMPAAEKERVMIAYREYAERWGNYFYFKYRFFRRFYREMRHEIKYGLKTQDFKSIYRLMIARKGHRRLFEALAQWLGEGHRLTIISGNHDQEFNQDLVRAGLLWMLEEVYREMLSAEKIAANQAQARSGESFKSLEEELAMPENHIRQAKNGHVSKAGRSEAGGITVEDGPATTNFSELITFERHGLDIDDSIRIEHGHRFEWLTRTAEDWHDPKHQEVQLAPGSLFNRYLINRVELEVPYLDNVKPSTRVIAYLAGHRPRRFLKLLWKFFLTAVQLARKQGVRKLIYSGFLQTARIVLPSVLSLWVLGYFFFFGNGAWSKILPFPGFLDTSLTLYIAALAAGGLMLLIKWELKRLKLHFSDEEAKNAMNWQDPPAEHSGKRYVIYGHTHKPDMEPWGNNTFYINSGTWTQVFEYEEGHVLEDITKNFIEFKKTTGNWEGELLRWNACHKCPENVILIEAREA